MGMKTGMNMSNTVTAILMMGTRYNIASDHCLVRLEGSTLSFSLLIYKLDI